MYCLAKACEDTEEDYVDKSDWYTKPQPELQPKEKIEDELDSQEELGEPVVQGAEVLCSNGSDKNVLNYLESFMFCEKGMGIIYFEKTGQEMGEFIEEAYTCQFVGYLAYGAGKIVTDSNGGFFKLYNAPTFKNSQEQKYFMDIYEKYGVETYYIPAIIGDTKGHSAPEGIFQTGVPFDGGDTVNTGDKGIIVEWYVDAGEGEENKSTGLPNFNTNGSIIYYYDEVLK